MAGDPYIPFYTSDWLAGTRGLTAAETGIYITLIMMMYEREAPLEMSEPRLARLCGATVTNFRRTLQALIDEGKISVVDNELWNSRVECELQKRTAKRENARASARQRWEKTEQNQRSGHANAMRQQCGSGANQSPESRDSGSGGSTRAPSRVAALSAAPSNLPQPTEREEALLAMGHDPTGMTANGRIVGGLVDMDEKRRWHEDLGLTHDQQICVIREIVAGKRDGPPVSFRYFTPAMQRLASELKRERLQPAQTYSAPPPAIQSALGAKREVKGKEKQRSLGRVITAAAAGTTQTEWG